MVITKLPAAVRGIVLLLSAAVASASHGAGWPMFAAHNAAPPTQKIDLVDDLRAMRKLFETTDLHAGVGKALYGSQRRLGQAMGIDVLPGGTSSPVLANGTLFISYYRPTGQPRLAGSDTTFRTLNSREGWHPEIWSIAADDCLLAIDARSGQKQWLARHHRKGLNRVTIKRNDWGPSPVYHQEMVFFLGTTGRVYAHHADSGHLAWEATVPAHSDLEKAKTEALQQKAWGPRRGLHTSCIVVEDVVVTASVLHEGLVGFDRETGQRLWTLSDPKRPYQSELATPRIWRHGDREFISSLL